MEKKYILAAFYLMLIVLVAIGTIITFTSENTLPIFAGITMIATSFFSGLYIVPEIARR